MNRDTWHSSFDPSRFLSKVDLDKLIERNEARNDSKVDYCKSPCILCSSHKSPGILLNDQSYLCGACFKTVSSISFPEKYEGLRRKHLSDKESRQLAYQEFRKKYAYHKTQSPLPALAFFSFGLLLFEISLVLVPILLIGIHLLASTAQNKKVKAWHALNNRWNKEFPEPQPPVLRHFHDPDALLSSRDLLVLKVFNNWPGYPPFWNYLKEVVLTRDRDHCQVTGCPSRVPLHVHHRIPVSKGGEHTPDNLVALCAFHHALEPDSGHERIWGSVKTQFFTLVRGHTRSNRSSEGEHYVRPHLRRLELIQASEMEDLSTEYGFSCPNCKCQDLEYSISGPGQKINVACRKCQKSWEGARKLTEETGPRLAELLHVSRNPGIWKARWDMLSSREESTFRTLTSKPPQSPNTPKRSKLRDKAPLCPKCESPMRIVHPRSGQAWDRFWGCSKYHTTGCKGSRRME